MEVEVEPECVGNLDCPQEAGVQACIEGECQVVECIPERIFQLCGMGVICNSGFTCQCTELSCTTFNPMFVC